MDGTDGRPGVGPGESRGTAQAQAACRRALARQRQSASTSLCVHLLSASARPTGGAGLPTGATECQCAHVRYYGVNLRLAPPLDPGPRGGTGARITGSDRGRAGAPSQVGPGLSSNLAP